MTERAAVFLFSKTKTHPDHQPVHGPEGFNYITGYVRMELGAPTDDLGDALDNAEPGEGEVVMNSHWVEDPILVLPEETDDN